jgi:hypothetical protein
MTAHEELWLHHVITAIGLSLNVFQAWPLLSMSDVGAEGIYQPVGDTSGIVFVRYGPEDTVEKYVGKLGGMFTQVSVVSDSAVVVDGLHARRVTVRVVSLSREMYDADMSEGVTHRTLPEERTYICVTGFSHRGLSILAGYRMPEKSLEQYRERLEQMLSSISLF